MTGITYFVALPLAAIGVWGASCAPVRAAEISAISPTEVVLEGEIQLGDYEKLRNLVDPNAEVSVVNANGDWFGDNYDKIYLASPGGNLAEAIKIGRLVRTLRWQTIIPSRFSNPHIKPETIFAKHHLKHPEANYACASACFFIFVAGVYRTSEEMDVEDNPILGIHRPYLTDNDLRSMSGGQAITTANELRAIVESYIKEMGIPSKYTDLMLSIPKDEVQWIDDATFKTDFKGVIPELRGWLDAQCDKRTDVEKMLWKDIERENKPVNQMTASEKSIGDALLKKMVAIDSCQINAREELRKNAWLEMYRPSWWRRIWRALGMDRDR